MAVGPKDSVLTAKEDMKRRFKCDDVGELKEHAGCKINRNHQERSIKSTQPVALQSFKNEFDVDVNAKHKTPAIAGQVSSKGENRTPIQCEEQKTHRKGVGKLLHVMRWSRPDVQNSTREVSRFTMKAGMTHKKALERASECNVGTPNRGLCLRPRGIWDGSKDYLFEIK